MWDDNECNCDFTDYDEEYRGYDIYIESNSDRYRGGYNWSVSDKDGIHEEDLNFSLNDCLANARKYIDELCDQKLVG